MELNNIIFQKYKTIGKRFIYLVKSVSKRQIHLCNFEGVVTLALSSHVSNIDNFTNIDNFHMSVTARGASTGFQTGAH